MELLELLAQAPEAAALSEYLPAAIRLLRRKLAALRRGGVPLEKLLVSQKLSRSLEEYRSPSPAAISAAQLESTGKTVRPGQRVRFLYIFGKPGVYAWDLPEPPRRDAINTPLYAELLIRSARTVLEAQGIDESRLRLWLNSPDGANYPAPGQMSFQPLKVSTRSLTSPPTG
jgi:DNA polymerase elongation subunit (family B)